jgi:hypothetical protein
MARVSARLAETLSARLARPISADLLIVDAPPAEREIEFRLRVRERGPGGGGWRNLADVSPVVRSLAHDQFDNLVKRVRVFAAPSDAEAIAGCPDLDGLLLDAARA